MEFNPQIHKRRSTRLYNYDYSLEGLYFITICAYNRACLFGRIEHGEMLLNDLGRVADQCWHSIPEHFPAVVIHEHVVMPNHVHGIIEISESDEVLQSFNAAVPQFQKVAPRSVGAIIRGFKIGVTKWARDNRLVNTVWQRNYHDHIIRNEKSHITIANYIENNPSTWEQDIFFEK